MIVKDKQISTSTLSTVVNMVILTIIAPIVGIIALVQGYPLAGITVIVVGTLCAILAFPWKEMEN